MRSSELTKFMEMPEVLASLTQEEIKRMIESLDMELNYRMNGENNGQSKQA